MIRTLHLERSEDVNGISGTGRVAEGVEFSDGTIVIHWLSHTPSTNMYSNAKQVEAVHGHGGRTRIVWHDALPPVDAQGAEELMS